MNTFADAAVVNARITTLGRARPEAEALATRNGTILAVGGSAVMPADPSPQTQRVDLHQRRVLPGLNDSHTQLIRPGLNFNMEWRWGGLPTLADINAAAPA